MPILTSLLMIKVNMFRPNHFAMIVQTDIKSLLHIQFFMLLVKNKSCLIINTEDMSSWNVSVGTAVHAQPPFQVPATHPCHSGTFALSWPKCVCGHSMNQTGRESELIEKQVFTLLLVSQPQQTAFLPVRIQALL